MSIQSTKALLWLGSAGLFGGLGYTLYDHVTHQAERSAPVSEADYEKFLREVEAPEPPKEDLVDYQAVLGTFHKLDWTGKPPPEPVPDTPVNTGPVVKPEIPVATLLEVLMTTVDSRTPEDSSVYVKLKDSAMVQASPQGDKIVLGIGATLPRPHEYVKVEKIEPGLVTFSFTDKEEREHEGLPVFTPNPDEKLIVVLGEGDEVIEVTESDVLIPTNTTIFKPERTYIRRSGDRTTEYKIGTKDREIWSNNYAQILANDVGYKNYRDPRTGKVAGVQITSVKAGSIAESHGVEAGIVVKSINGEPVTSKSAAISYVKRNSDTTSTWVVVYMKQGKEYTATYESD